EELEEYLAALEEALHRGDAWEGFSFFLAQMFHLQARQPGLCHAPFMQRPNASGIEEVRALMTRLTEQLIDRAKQAGSLRPDVTAQDVMLAGWGNTGVISSDASTAPVACGRYLEFILDAFRAK